MVESAGLEHQYIRKDIASSNLALSVSDFIIRDSSSKNN